MSAQQPARSLDAVACKWRDLAERRRAHLFEMYRSGRWKHYYRTEDEFFTRMHQAMRDVEAWSDIVPPPPQETIEAAKAA
jgi:uncharacterized repeat protein (TIGR03809 family)